MLPSMGRRPLRHPRWRVMRHEVSGRRRPAFTNFCRSLLRELGRVDADGVGEIKELHHIDPSLSTFDSRDVGLPPIQAMRQLRLR